MSLLIDHLRRMASATPERVAIEYPGGAANYRQLWALVVALSAQLAAKQPRAIGLGLENGLDWIVAHLACVHLAVPQIPLPPFFTAAQRQHALQDAGANMLVSHDAQGALTLVPLAYTAVTLPGSTSLITYTSGSTGAPKGVCLSQAGMEQVAQSLLSVLGDSVAQRHLAILPLAVLLEQIGGLYVSLLAGGTYVVRGPQEMKNIAHTLRDARATSGILVPELLKQLLEQCGRAADLPHLKFLAVGGARVAESLIIEAELLGLPVYQGYGLSESASVVAVNTPKQHRMGTVGKLLPHIHCSVAEDGEIILHDPAYLGYVGTARQADYPTGDTGSIDARGFLSIEGRKKNILITGYGRNVAPEWPESALLSQPQIAQAMVYGDAQATLSALIVPVSAQVSDASLQQAVACANATLPDYARIGEWKCAPPFTVENGLLTGTGRIRREAIMESLVKETSDGFLRTACA